MTIYKKLIFSDTTFTPEPAVAQAASGVLPDAP
jgi:hypothetical protein